MTKYIIECIDKRQLELSFEILCISSNLKQLIELISLHGGFKGGEQHIELPFSYDILYVVFQIASILNDKPKMKTSIDCSKSILTNFYYQSSLVDILNVSSFLKLYDLHLLVTDILSEIYISKDLYEIRRGLLKNCMI